MSSAQTTQNKAGKKKKQSAMSLGEFYAQVDTTGSGASGGGPPKSWADEMNSLDTEKPPLDLNEIRSQLPTAPKAALAPDINLDLVPKNPPFTAHLSNVSYEADDSKIRAFFLDSKILNVRLPQDERGRFRGFGQVDFEDRESLINALAKNETKFFNRPIKVQLESVYKQQRERAHGGFHGSSSGAAGESNSDDIDWRARPNPEPESEQLPSRQYSQTSFMNRQQRNPDFSGGQQQQQPQRRWQNRQEGEQQSDRRQGGYQRNEGGYQRNEGGYQRNEGGYQQRSEGGSFQRNEGGYQRQGGYNRPSGGYNRPQQDQTFEQRPQHQPASENTEGGTQSATTELKERPKIMLQPRTLPPKELEGDAMATASGIFGSAKPVNTAAKEREIEEKIAKEREALALAQQQQKENEEKELQEAHKPPAQPAHERSHKTSFNSDDGRKHHNKSESEFTTVTGGKRQNKNDQHQNRNYNNNNNNQRLSQSSSFTSPPSGNRQFGGHQNRSGGGGDSTGHQQQPSQNAWARSGGKPADLFTSNNSSHQESEQTTSTTTTHQAAPFTKPTNNANRTYTNSKYQNRPQSNRDNNNKDMNRRFNDKNTKTASGGRGGGRPRNETTNRGPGGASSAPGSGNINNPNTFNPPVAEVKESGPGKIENKFAALTVDDDGDGDYFDDEGDYEDDDQQQHEENVAAN